MADLGYSIFDADNHYYEAEDAFTRHMDPRMARRAMQWATVGGKQRLLVGGKLNRFIPNPLFDPVARPGCLEDFYRGKTPPGMSIAEAFGALEPINPAYRDRDVRVKVLDAQNIQGAFFFPTLGVGMEEALKHDIPALTAAFRAFNRWLDDDWGFAYQEKIFAAPYFTLADVDWAVSELEWALERDLRILVMRCGPVPTADGSRSPGDPIYDPFWARVAEAGVTVAFHGGDSGYAHYAEDWGERGDMMAFKASPIRTLMSASPTHDMVAAMIGGGVFKRHPNIRLAMIENGSGWVFSLFKTLRRTGGRMNEIFGGDPEELFRRHVWVSPFFEDGLDELRTLIGPDRMMAGSDFPHAEGIAEPTDWVNNIPGFAAQEQRLIMRENALSLSTRRAPSAA